MKSADYWKKRALAREAQSRKIANRELVKDILPAYDRAAKQITENVRQIFERYAKDGELTEAEARKLLNVQETEEILNKLREELKEIKDPQLRRKALNRLNAPAYAARISRLEALREQIYAEMAKVSDKEIETTGKVISKSYERTYYRSIFDTQVGTGFAFSFTQLPQQAIKTVLGEAWIGAHFSRRVWHNTQMLAQEAEKVITSGIISGASVPRMAKQIEDAMQTGKYAATRLIRTEANRAYNAAELDSCKELGIEKYVYLAALDKKTCVVCGRLDHKTFPIEEAKEGVNLPPMHPNDRCSIAAHFDNKNMEGLKRRAKDPVTNRSWFPGAWIISTGKSNTSAGNLMQNWQSKCIKTHRPTVSSLHGIVPVLGKRLQNPLRLFRRSSILKATNGKPCKRITETNQRGIRFDPVIYQERSMRKSRRATFKGTGILQDAAI